MQEQPVGTYEVIDAMADVDRSIFDGLPDSLRKQMVGRRVTFASGEILIVRLPVMVPNVFISAKKQIEEYFTAFGVNVLVYSWEEEIRFFKLRKVSDQDGQDQTTPQS